MNLLKLFIISLNINEKQATYLRVLLLIINIIHMVVYTNTFFILGIHEYLQPQKNDELRIASKIRIKIIQASILTM